MQKHDDLIPLLDAFMEGDTSFEEDKYLQKVFREFKDNEVPSELKEYVNLFAMLDLLQDPSKSEEIKAQLLDEHEITNNIPQSSNREDNRTETGEPDIFFPPSKPAWKMLPARVSVIVTMLAVLSIYVSWFLTEQNVSNKFEPTAKVSTPHKNNVKIDNAINLLGLIRDELCFDNK